MPNTRPSLVQLEMRGNFINRHIGSNSQQIKAMLAELGLNELEDIIEQAIPADILNHEPLKLTETISEQAVIKYLRKIRARNKVYTSMIGMGYYDTIMPMVIKHNVLENPAWYTAYTPYQAEVSQGRLEALLNFQQMIIDLTGMELANASLLDEATAAAEAMTMSRRLSPSLANAIFVDQDCHPQTIAVVKTRAHALGYDVVVGNPYQNLAQQDFFALLIQYPDTKGEIRDLTEITAIAHNKSALVTVAADLLSLVLLKPPAAFGVDIHNVLACLWGMAVLMQHFLPPKMNTNVPYLVVLSACPKINTGNWHCAWHYKPVNNIFAATKLLAISARLKCYSRLLLVFMPSITGRIACA
jgi:glycine dehydrogenase